MIGIADVHVHTLTLCASDASAILDEKRYPA